MRYTLIVSISATEADIDIYAPIANTIAAQIQIQA